jgi:hypothetical protein
MRCLIATRLLSGSFELRSRVLKADCTMSFDEYTCLERAIGFSSRQVTSLLRATAPMNTVFLIKSFLFLIAA